VRERESGCIKSEIWRQMGMGLCAWDGGGRAGLRFEAIDVQKGVYVIFDSQERLVMIMMPVRKCTPSLL